MQEPNLRPYGSPMAPTGPAVGADTFQDAVRARARDKLDFARHTGQRAAGGHWAFVLRLFLLLLLIGGIPAALMLAGLLGQGVFYKMKGDPGVTIFLAATIILLVAIPVAALFYTRPRSPKAALREFLKAVCLKHFKRARKLVVAADFDNMPREAPQISGLGNPVMFARRFGVGDVFEQYWTELLHNRKGYYCRFRLNQLQVEYPAPDVALVTAGAKFVFANSTIGSVILLVGLLGTLSFPGSFGIALLIAIVVGLVTRTSVEVPVRKVLVRSGEEWLVFNGELMGADEHDLRWLQPAT